MQPCHGTNTASSPRGVVADDLGLASEVDLVRVKATVCGFLTGTASRASLTTDTGGTGRGRVFGGGTVTGTLAGGTRSCRDEERGR